MLRAWLRKLLPPPPRPSAYISQFLAGEISPETFGSNIGDGWVGSDLKDWSWLDRIYDIEKRYNPDFPSGEAGAWRSPDAIDELRALAVELRASGK